MMNLNYNTVVLRFYRMAELWNKQDLEGVCRSYAPDASYITKKGIVHGRVNILEAYRQSYSDPARMGQLSLSLIELRPLAVSDSGVYLALANLQWELNTNGNIEHGYSALVLEACGNEIQVIQDVSM